MRDSPAALAYTIRQAADVAGLSAKTIDRATKTTDPRGFPPPLACKRAGTGATAKRLILASELHRWLNSLPDA